MWWRVWEREKGYSRQISEKGGREEGEETQTEKKNPKPQQIRDLSLIRNEENAGW